MTHDIPPLPGAGCALPSAFARWPGAEPPTRRNRSPATNRRRPTPAEVKALAVHPDEDHPQGQRCRPATHRHRHPGRRPAADLTGDVKYEVADQKVVRVTPGGRVAAAGQRQHRDHRPLRRQHRRRSPSRPRACDENLPINFGNQIVPIFTKLGCNSGGCHGKASGQNGFKLSLLGFEPEVDYNALVKEARGRASVPRRPGQQPAAAQGDRHDGPRRRQAHGGRLRRVQAHPPLDRRRHCPSASRTIPIVDQDHRLPRAPHPDRATTGSSSPSTPTTATAASRTSPAGPSTRATTRKSPSSTATGLVRTLALSGEAAIMARYQGQVAIFRATVPLGVKIPDYKFEPKTVVDQLTQKKWQELGIVPSELCTDEQFIRRVSLDITGTLPTPDAGHGLPGRQRRRQARQAGRRLLETPEYSYYFANKWADILRVKRAATSRTGPTAPSPSTTGFARRSPRTSPTTSSPARSWRPPATRRNPADRVVQGAAEARAVRRRHRPGVPRPAHGLCPVPPPSLREVEPGRLLGPGRLLRPGRPQERADARRASRTSRRSAQVIFNQSPAATSSTSAPASRPS